MLYSNIGYDLLGDALGQAAGIPYVKALAEKVTGPLGLRDTTMTPTKAQCARLMAGDALAGKTPTTCADTSNVAGSAGLYTTAGDMAVWLRHELAIGPDAGSESAARRAISQKVYLQRSAFAQVEGTDNGGKVDGIGLGWMYQAAHDGRPALTEKTGGHNGFVAYVVMVQEHKLGIFVAVSKLDVPMLRVLSGRINDLAVDLAREPAANTAP